MTQLTNMEKLEQVRAGWVSILRLEPNPIANRLITFIAFQDLLFERSMTTALSATSPNAAAEGEWRQNALSKTLDRLVRLAMDLDKFAATKGKR